MLCFLDMDGVIADFVGGVCKAHERPNPFGEHNFGGGAWDMAKGWGISETAFWKPTNHEGFWSGLEKTPEADYIVALMCGHFGTENVCILTAPAMNPYCVQEKEEWIKKYYPHLKKQILLTGPLGRGYAKRYLAGEGRVLVDDRDKNIDDFRESGGIGIVVPRLWNSEWQNADKLLEVLERKINEL